VAAFSGAPALPHVAPPFTACLRYAGGRDPEFSPAINADATGLISNFKIPACPAGRQMSNQAQIANAKNKSKFLKFELCH